MIRPCFLRSQARSELGDDRSAQRLEFYKERLRLIIPTAAWRAFARDVARASKEQEVFCVKMTKRAPPRTAAPLSEGNKLLRAMDLLEKPRPPGVVS